MLAIDAANCGSRDAMTTSTSRLRSTGTIERRPSRVSTRPAAFSAGELPPPAALRAGDAEDRRHGGNRPPDPSADVNALVRGQECRRLPQLQLLDGLLREGTAPQAFVLRLERRLHAGAGITIVPEHHGSGDRRLDDEPGARLEDGRSRQDDGRRGHDDRQERDHGRQPPLLQDADEVGETRLGRHAPGSVAARRGRLPRRTLAFSPPARRLSLISLRSSDPPRRNHDRVAGLHQFVEARQSARSSCRRRCG